MKINPNLWFLLAIIVILTQFYIFPISVFYSNYFIAAVLYSILPILFCYLGLSKVSSITDLLYPPKNIKNTNFIIKGLVYFFVFIISMVVCFVFVPKKLESLLLTEGIVEQGLITEVNQINEKSVEVVAIVRKNVGEEPYNKDIKLVFRDKKLINELPNTIERGRAVEIIHLEDNLSNVKILCTEKDYVKYRNLKNENLNLVDLENFLLMDKSKRISYLNSKSGFWKFYQNNSFEKIYINYIKKEKIVFHPEEKYFTYIKEGEKLPNFEANLQQVEISGVENFVNQFSEIDFGNIKCYKNLCISVKQGFVAIDPNYNGNFGFSCVVFKK